MATTTDGCVQRAEVVSFIHPPQAVSSFSYRYMIIPFGIECIRSDVPHFSKNRCSDGGGQELKLLICYFYCCIRFLGTISLRRTSKVRAMCFERSTNEKICTSLHYITAHSPFSSKRFWYLKRALRNLAHKIPSSGIFNPSISSNR